MMSDRIRQGLAYLIAVGMVAAVAAAPTVAQTTDENAERLFEAAGVSVDQVDGLDATKYTTNRVKRAGKIVATNANGVLPSNIVKPQWRVIQNMPDGFADGVDNKGVTGVTVTRAGSGYVAVPPDEEAWAIAECPAGSTLIAGGFGSENYDIRIAAQGPTTNGWAVAGKNFGPVNRQLWAYATCMTATPGGALTAATRGIDVASKHSR